METQIINIYGGPGAGKSTTAAGLFHHLKADNINAELVTEFAKELVWRGEIENLKCQPYVYGEQLRRIESLIGKVDVIVTDSPLLNNVTYGCVHAPQYTDKFYEGVREYVQSIPNQKHFFLTRCKDYLSKGRLETLEKAKKRDVAIQNELIGTFGVDGYTVIEAKTPREATMKMYVMVA